MVLDNHSWEMYDMHHFCSLCLLGKRCLHVFGTLPCLGTLPCFRLLGFAGLLLRCCRSFRDLFCCRCLSLHDLLLCLQSLLDSCQRCSWCRFLVCSSFLCCSS